MATVSQVRDSPYLIEKGKNMMLVENALYLREDRVVFAEGGLLRDLIEDKSYVPSGEEKILAAPEDQGYGRRLINLVRHWSEEASAWEKRFDHMTRKFEGLGKDLLQHAIDNEWGEEYDAFADEWDLPTRPRDFTVNINMVITTRNRDNLEDVLESRVGNLSGLDDFEVQSVDIRFEDDRYV